MKSNRRDFIHTVLRASAAMPLAGLAACKLFEEKEMRIGPLDQIKDPEGVVAEFNGRRILARMLDDKPVVFSLVCTHKRCTVKWKAWDQRFECPCHEGLYDEQGEVLDGPPPAPLRRYQHEVRGTEVWVLNAWVGEE